MVNYSSSLDRAFSALSDPTRRAILARLALGESRVTDLADPFDMSLPAVSKHLKVLEEAGLVRKRREGRTHHCRLDPKPLTAAADWIAQHRAFWEKAFEGPRIRSSLSNFSTVAAKRKSSSRTRGSRTRRRGTTTRRAGPAASNSSESIFR